MESAIPDLLGIVQDAANVAAVRPLNADQVAQQVGVAFGKVRAIIVDEERDDALFHLLSRGLDAVVVVDLQAPGDDVAQEAESLRVSLRRGTAAEEPEA